MTTARLLLTTVSLAILAVVPLHAAVHITVLDEQVQETEAGQRVIQPVVLANENAHYTLTYDVIRDPETPDEVTSNWWQWTQGYVTIGMTEPSRPNWYWQGFLRWTFDDESLHVRPAQFRVVRQSGQDGMVEYLWDTPKVRARLRFALATGSDKLLMFADWEPKGQIQQTRMQLSCYPATFAEPRNRRVTTALGTREPGETIDLDLRGERWVLYEDVTEGRPAQGSAGLLIGTPQAFSAVQIPVADYGIVTTLEMAPQAPSFALGLYDFPTLPDYQRTREYFGRSADAEARQIEEMAAGDLDQPLPPMPMDEQRLAQLLAEGADMLDRPAELWRPDPDPLDFPWAAEIPGEPIRTAIFSRRWTAWETMELARRLEMDAEHLYFDANDRLVNPRAWPYAAHTGIGALPQGVAARRAAELASDETMDLFLCGGIHGTGIPGVARTAIMQQVANGAGLLICGHDATSGWEEELFADLDAEMTDSVLDGFSWELIPGYRDIDRGRVEGEPPVRVYRHGEGRVVHLNVNLNTYSSLVPRNDAAEGLQAATDHCLAIAARCALAAAGREMTDSREDGDSLLIRVQDDLGRVLHLDEQADTRMLDLPVLPTGRTYYTDILVRNAAGETIGMASRVQGPVLEAERARIIGLSISPATVTHEPAVPMVEMPDGGTVECTARLQNLGDDAWLRWEVRDAFDRLVAREMTRVSPGEEAASASLDLPPPVTVCHTLDVALTREDEELSYARQRFTMSMDYPYDDFTALMWTYAGGDPVLRLTDRMCYEWGADMCDLCHMGGYSDAGAAREYEVSARSGLRLIPYVTRIAGSANEDYERVPCLHSPDYIASEREKLTTTCRQAAPYSPAAYTLGDENYLFRGDFECCHTEWSVAAFQQWLQGKYGTIAALNAAWASDYDDFTEIQRPMILSEAAEQTKSFAPWIDHKLFMDTAFADAHERAAGFVRAQDPGAKVGWDGLLGYNWRAGYDFDKLTRTLELNETYTMQWLEGELVRSFKRDDALTGKWGNAIADNEEGWHAFPWDCLLAGDNSVWWWTSWGCDYIPFNPDLTQSTFGQWFFEAVQETTSGPGKLLLHSGRVDTPIAVLYSHRDLFAATIMGQMVQDQPWAGDGHFLDQHEGLLRGIRDLGYQYRHITFEQLEEGLSPDDYRVLVLPLASCLSDGQVDVIREFVENGGTLLVDGRAGMLTGEGRIRNARPLDEVLGVRSEAGLQALMRASTSAPLAIEAGAAGGLSVQGTEAEVRVLEPGLQVDGATALATAGDVPVLAVNELGEGRAVTLNADLRGYSGSRLEDRHWLVDQALAATLRAAGLEPPARVTLPDGARPLCVQQVLFGDGPARYLALSQDILARGLAQQQLHIELPQPSIVYDLRAGERIGEGAVSEWDATISRGEPLVYSLLPYEVEAVALRAPADVERGQTAEIAVSVGVSEGQPADHVVRIDLFAPGTEAPHRQYSQNVLCEDGAGSATVPFALNDARGTWRVEARDVASGVSVRQELQMR